MWRFLGRTEQSSQEEEELHFLQNFDINNILIYSILSYLWDDVQVWVYLIWGHVGVYLNFEFLFVNL